jgi:hypothetical protein
MSLSATVPARLPVRATFLTQLAASFAGRLTPASAGGYAVNIRFLRHAGVPTPVAATAVGLKSLLSLVTQTGLLVLFLVLAGSSGARALPRPPMALLVGAAVVLVVAGVAAAVPVGRELVRRRLWPATRQAIGSLHLLAERPARLLLAIAGSVVGIGCTMLALDASLLAFQAHLPVATLGLVVLGASAAAAHRLRAVRNRSGAREAASRCRCCVGTNTRSAPGCVRNSKGAASTVDSPSIAA